MSSIRLADVQEVAKGAQTDVLAKAEGIDPAKCFSLVTEQRSLHLVMASVQDRETMLRAIRVIMADAALSPSFV